MHPHDIIPRLTSRAILRVSLLVTTARPILVYLSIEVDAATHSRSRLVHLGCKDQAYDASNTSSIWGQILDKIWTFDIYVQDLQESCHENSKDFYA